MLFTTTLIYWNQPRGALRARKTKGWKISCEITFLLHKLRVKVFFLLSFFSSFFATSNFISIKCCQEAELIKYHIWVINTSHLLSPIPLIPKSSSILPLFWLYNLRHAAHREDGKSEVNWFYQTPLWGEALETNTIAFTCCFTLFKAISLYLIDSGIGKQEYKWQSVNVWLSYEKKQRRKDWSLKVSVRVFNLRRSAEHFSFLQFIKATTLVNYGSFSATLSGYCQRLAKRVVSMYKNTWFESLVNFIFNILKRLNCNKLFACSSRITFFQAISSLCYSLCLFRLYCFVVTLEQLAKALGIDLIDLL